MTESEKQEIISRVLSALSTNSATIDQMMEVYECVDDDYFETNKGNKVSFGAIRKPFERRFSELSRKIDVFRNVCSRFEALNNESELPYNPSESDKTIGYIINKELYLYVGTGGNVLNGKYINVGAIVGPQGEVGPDGPQGLIGPVGPKGEQGNSGVSGSTDNIEVVNNLDGGESTQERIKVLAAEQGKVLNEKFSELDGNIDSVIKELQVTSWRDLPLEGETVNCHISGVTGKVVIGSSSSVLIQVTSEMIGKSIKLIPADISGNNTYGSALAFLKDKSNLDSNGATPNYCDGTSVKNYKNETILTIPTDCTYIYTSPIISGVDYRPKALYIGEYGGETRLDKIEKEITDMKLDVILFSDLPIVGETITSYISTIDKVVITTGDNRNTLIPVTSEMIGKSIKLVPANNKSSIVFLRDKTNLDVEKGVPNLCIGTSIESYNQTKYFTIPNDCNYIYVSQRILGTDYTPTSLSIETSVSNAIENLSTNYRYIEPIETLADKCIDKISGIINLEQQYKGMFHLKKYAVNADGIYYADVYIGGSVVSYAGIGYTDADDSYLGYEYPANKAGKSTAKFNRLNIPEDAKYIYVFGVEKDYISQSPYHQEANLYVRNTMSDIAIVPNILYYYISKVRNNILTSVENTTEIHDDVIDSAWGIMFPKSYSPNGDKTTVIAMLHGSTGVVSLAVLGYSNSGWIAWRQLYLDAGFAVMDVNGYGVSTSNDQKSQHWGNPASVETLKHAFDFLKQNFNIHDKIILQGSSMGGLLSISYALTHPNDVLCVGNFAPAVLSRMAKYQEGGGSYAKSTAIAWGYETAQQIVDDKLSRFVGYDLLMKGLFINAGLVQDIDWGEFECDSYFDNTEVVIKTNFSIPYRIWVGSLDNLVPPKLIKMVVKALRNGGSNATYRIYEGVGHGMCSGSENSPALYNEALNWYKRFVK